MLEIGADVSSLIEKLSTCSEVVAIALGGSRAINRNDSKSDYDVYLYLTEPLSHGKRHEILSFYCATLEIGNHYWEEEDNCVLNSGTDIDFLYRNFSDFTYEIAQVVEKHQAANGYTTCMWANLESCVILYEKDFCLSAIKARFAVSYPQALKKAIIERNMALLTTSIASYRLQIQKAVARQDSINVVNRVSVFLDSYFDIIYALNELKNPGEKRNLAICLATCKTLPQHFEYHLNQLLQNLGKNQAEIPQNINQILTELEKIIK